ncbi:Conserved_hypothetical protein [Hexamita inflata]|uniref:Uncharacterized protein n=1 Tax=Hexamita inflata TaxID=28002 RepID=A0ABP1HJV2_9EUKA
MDDFANLFGPKKQVDLSSIGAIVGRQDQGFISLADDAKVSTKVVPNKQLRINSQIQASENGDSSLYKKGITYLNESKDLFEQYVNLFDQFQDQSQTVSFTTFLKQDQPITSHNSESKRYLSQGNTFQVQSIDNIADLCQFGCDDSDEHRVKLYQLQLSQRINADCKHAYLLYPNEAEELITQNPSYLNEVLKLDSSNVLKTSSKKIQEYAIAYNKEQTRRKNLMYKYIKSDTVAESVPEPEKVNKIQTDDINVQVLSELQVLATQFCPAMYDFSDKFLKSRENKMDLLEYRRLEKQQLIQSEKQQFQAKIDQMQVLTKQVTDLRTQIEVYKSEIEQNKQKIMAEEANKNVLIESYNSQISTSKQVISRILLEATEKKTQYEQLSKQLQTIITYCSVDLVKQKQKLTDQMRYLEEDIQKQELQLNQTQEKLNILEAQKTELQLNQEESNKKIQKYDQKLQQLEAELQERIDVNVKEINQMLIEFNEDYGNLKIILGNLKLCQRDNDILQGRIKKLEVDIEVLKADNDKMENKQQ